MSKPKPEVPKHQQRRVMKRTNLTLDADTNARLERLREMHGLDSISQTIRWLARQHS